MKCADLPRLKMSERPSNRPGKAEPWPKQYRKLTMQLEKSDQIFFRSVIEMSYTNAINGVEPEGSKSEK